MLAGRECCNTVSGDTESNIGRCTNPSPAKLKHVFGRDTADRQPDPGVKPSALLRRIERLPPPPRYGLPALDNGYHPQLLSLEPVVTYFESTSTPPA